MLSKRTFKSRYVICFCLILVLWILGIQNISSENLTVTKGTRYTLYGLWLFAVAIIGYIGWLQHPFKWVKNIWLFSYLMVISLLTVLGIVDLFITDYDKDFVKVLRLFVQSPLPFALLYLFVKVSYKKRLEYIEQM